MVTRFALAMLSPHGRKRLTAAAYICSLSLTIFLAVSMTPLRRAFGASTCTWHDYTAKYGGCVSDRAVAGHTRVPRSGFGTFLRYSG
ncbi:MAG: hypothetical protein ACYS83_09750 [Planctomycetota bacterium]